MSVSILLLRFINLPDEWHPEYIIRTVSILLLRFNTAGKEREEGGKVRVSILLLRFMRRHCGATGPRENKCVSILLLRFCWGLSSWPSAASRRRCFNPSLEIPRCLCYTFVTPSMARVSILLLRFRRRARSYGAGTRRRSCFNPSPEIPKCLHEICNRGGA